MLIQASEHGASLIQGEPNIVVSILPDKEVRVLYMGRGLPDQFFAIRNLAPSQDPLPVAMAMFEAALAHFAKVVAAR